MIKKPNLDVTLRKAQVKLSSVYMNKNNGALKVGCSLLQGILQHKQNSKCNLYFRFP